MIQPQYRNLIILCVDFVYMIYWQSGRHLHAAKSSVFGQVWIILKWGDESFTGKGYYGCCWYLIPEFRPALWSRCRGTLDSQHLTVCKRSNEHFAIASWADFIVLRESICGFFQFMVMEPLNPLRDIPVFITVTCFQTTVITMVTNCLPFVTKPLVSYLSINMSEK